MIDARDKDPDALQPYTVRFDRWLDQDDTLASATIIIALGTATVDGEEVSGTLAEDHTDVADTEVRVWLGGGHVGETSSVTVRVTTTGGARTDYTFKIRVREQ